MFRDVRKFKETKKHFDRVREDLEIAQVKNAQAPKNKPHEVEEATGTLAITRKCFRHLALDYVLQVRKQTPNKKDLLQISAMHLRFVSQSGKDQMISPQMKNWS